MNYLDQIVESKHKEIEKLDSLNNYKARMQDAPRLDIRSIKWTDNLDVISEIKRKSPSKGDLASIEDPTELAKIYEKAGAVLISVLTDEQYFGAVKDDLARVRESVKLPILRKDFIVDERQVYESYFMGADVVLLIVAAIKNEDRLSTLFELAMSLGLSVIVEAHDEKEYDEALAIGALAVGVNTRDLNSFEEKSDIAKKIFSNKNHKVVNIWESGIISLDDAKQANEAGADAVLIGQGLVQNEDPGEFIAQIRQLS